MTLAAVVRERAKALRDAENGVGTKGASALDLQRQVQAEREATGVVLGDLADIRARQIPGVQAEFDLLDPTRTPVVLAERRTLVEAETKTALDAYRHPCEPPPGVTVDAVLFDLGALRIALARLPTPTPTVATVRIGQGPPGEGPWPPKGAGSEVSRDLLGGGTPLPSWAAAVPTAPTAPPALVQLTAGGLTWDLSLPLAQAAFLNASLSVTLIVGAQTTQTVLDRAAAIKLGLCP